MPRAVSPISSLIPSVDTDYRAIVGGDAAIALLRLARWRLGIASETCASAFPRPANLIFSTILGEQMATLDLGMLFSSPTFGFLMKLFSSIATTGFGILGIGATTRDASGKLTRNGRIALIGIIVAGSLAVGTCIFDFVSTQDAERASRQRSELLFKSVQRGIYPLRGAKVNVTMRLAGDAEVLKDYKHILHEAINADRKCHATKRNFVCYGLDTATNTYRAYKVPRTSDLFPRTQSNLRRVLDHLAVQVMIYASSASLTQPAPKLLPQNVKRLGWFFVAWNETGIPEQTTLLYDYSADSLSIEIEDFPVADSEIATAGIYSLVDFLPGYLRLTPQLSEALICSEISRTGICSLPTLTALHTGLSLTEFAISFPYPKQLRVFESAKTVCKAEEGNGGSTGLALALPGDVEAIDSLGNITMLSPSVGARSSCTAISAVGTDTKMNPTAEIR